VKQLIGLIPALFLLASCAATPAAAPKQRLPNEIADHPQILLDGSVPLDEMALKGVKLGDPESAIAESRIEKRSDAGWIVCSDGTRYRVADGRVITLGAWDKEILKSLNIRSPADIEQRFGKPDSNEEVAPITIYHFKDGRLSVLWNTFENQINAVNVSK
jgi:hypothetical protein